MTGFVIAAAGVSLAVLHVFRLAVPPRRDLVTAVDLVEARRKSGPASSGSAHHKPPPYRHG